MTTEEKAKAYDKAIERAREKYNSKYHPSEGPSGIYLNNADLEEIFPELKESEDEKIRKELMCHIQGEIDTYDNMVSGDYDSRDKEDKKVHSMLERAKAYLEKQKEQKPVYEDRYQKMLADSYKCGKNEVIDNPEKYGLQKPAEWSEDDEKHLKSIISTIEMCMEDCENASAVLGYYDSDISWLKSLKNRGNSPKSNANSPWKPSEEQMWALQAIINDPNNAGAESCQLALKSLLKDLKNGETK